VLRHPRNTSSKPAEIPAPKGAHASNICFSLLSNCLYSSALSNLGKTLKQIASKYPFLSLKLLTRSLPDVGHNSAAMSHHYTHVGKEALAKAAQSPPEI
jgi:hypothetical protein